MVSLIGLYLKYQYLRASAIPETFGIHLSLNLLGSIVGWKSRNFMEPRAIHHNNYLNLLAPSGKYKSASQDIQRLLIPSPILGSASFTPAGLLDEMSGREAVLTKKGEVLIPAVPPKPELNCPLGEFSTLLRGIKTGSFSGSHMADFKEISNDLHGCPTEYKKKLKDMSYYIKQPYLSMSTTCTPDEFFINLSPDMVNGGFLPRWILVEATPPRIKRKKLHPNIDFYENWLKDLFFILYTHFSMYPITFELTEDAENINEKYASVMEDGAEYKLIQPFVARYKNYLIAYADLLRLSDIIGELLVIHNKKELDKLEKIEDLDKLDTVEMSSNSSILSNSSNSLKKIEVGPAYIEKSWELLKPCLDTAIRVHQYVNQDFFINTVKRHLDRLPPEGEEEWSDLLRNTGLMSSKLRFVVATLEERQEVTLINREKVKGNEQSKATFVKKTRRYK